jgi:outer membrane biosynthesis protein TonB
VKGARRLPDNKGLGVVGSVAVHGLVVAAVFGGTARRPPPPPVYRVHLIAAPEPSPEARKASKALERPSEPEAPAAPLKSKNKIGPAPPPPPKAATEKHEAAPKGPPTPVTPLPGEKPGTGTDVASVSTEGVEFPYPEYLQNLMTQILRVWQRPFKSTALDAEVSFFIHRDGSISGLQFVKRSGDFGYDLEAQGAVEDVGRRRAFGPLPSGWNPDVLFVRFYFSGQRQ